MNVAPSSHTNYRYLSTPEKIERLRGLHQESRSAQKKLHRIQVKVAEYIESRGVTLDAETTVDIQQIMQEHEHHIIRQFPPGSFQSVFWKQQKEAALCKDKRGIRWHPAMVKWCLYLRHQSSKAYETLQKSGCLQLPSQCTLRDYTHCVKSDAGFSAEVDLQLMQAIGLPSCQQWEKLLVLLLDEMYIKEDLVYNKHTGQLIGFASLGDANDHLLAFERSVVEGQSEQIELAKTMVVFMVRSLLTPFRFPYAQFPCAS